MSDYRKSREQLIEEVENLRWRIAELENSDSERKQSEEGTQNNSLFQQMLMDAIPSPIFYKDTDGVYRGGNKALERLWGRPLDQIIGKTVYDISPPNLAEIYERADKELLNNPGVRSYETSVTSSNGIRRNVILNKATFTNAKGDVAGLIGVIADITERKQAEAVIQKSEELLKEAQQVAHVGHWELDNVTGILKWSEEIFNIFGIDPAQSEPSFEAQQKIIHPDDWDILNKAVEKARIEGIPFDIEFRLFRPDASIRWMNSKGNITRDGEGHIVRIFGIAQDITERKQVEEKLKASLLEKETMLKEIHHRVKNNLQVIQSLLNLQTRKIKDPEVLELFRQSHDRIQSMALVHEKLYGSSDLDRIEMADYLRNLSGSLFYSYRANLDGVDLKIEVEEVQVGIDKAIPLGLIINELVTNALKHGFPAGGGGEIRVELALVDEGMIRLSVGDNGIDFPREVDFQKTASTGFQLVMALVQQLEGTITIHQGGGTEFRVTFPKK